MKLFLRLIILLALAWLGYVLFREAHAADDPEHPGDLSKIVVLFAGVIMVALAAGTILTLWIVPAIGDQFGSFFFNPDQTQEKDPHAVAMSKVAQGDYHGAVEAYARIVEANPEDTHAMSEIVHIYCDRIGDPHAAAELLDNALQNEWPVEQTVFLASRLADVYWDYLRDADRARAVLEQVIGTAPGTRHAANATHRMRDIERILASGHIPPPKGPVATHDESALPPGDGEV